MKYAKHYQYPSWLRCAGLLFASQVVPSGPRCYQNVPSVLIFVAQVSEVWAAELSLEGRLKKFSLALEPTKTRLVRFGKVAQRDVESKGQKLETLYFLGFTFYCGKNRNGKFSVGLKTEKSRLKRGHQKLKLLMNTMRHEPLKAQQQKINAFLTGHYNYYGVRGNYASLVKLFCSAVKGWRQALSSRSQRGLVIWKKYTVLLKLLPLRKPKLRYSYQQFREMALLWNYDWRARCWKSARRVL